ncbi:MAG: transposase [Nitrospinae bacterium]|nr:transposase [Nitrospinota bacterium]
MEITKAYKYQLKPRDRHVSSFESWSGACRFLWNVMLEYREMTYKADQLVEGRDVLEKWLLYKILNESRKVEFKAEHTEGEAEKAKVQEELPARLLEVKKRHTEAVAGNFAKALAIIDWSAGMAIQRSAAKKESGSTTKLKPLTEQFVARKKAILAPWSEGGSMDDFRSVMEKAKTPLMLGKSVTLREMQVKPSLAPLGIEFEWFAEVPSCSLQQVIKNQDVAFKRFFQGQARFPNRKRRGQDSFYLDNAGAVSVAGNKAKIRNMGEVRFFQDREIEERWSKKENRNSATVSKSGNKWYISFSINEKIPDPQTPKGEIGLDRGITSLVAFSDGRLTPPVNSLEKTLGKLAKAQRVMAKKDKGSNRWRKQVKRIAKIHHEIGNSRKTYLHKLSKQVTEENGLIVLEDLQVRNMSASAKGTEEAPGKNVRSKAALNRRILDQGWGELRRQLEYKAVWEGGEVIAVPPQYTSQQCSACGHTHEDNRDGAKFLCGECGHEENADVNAAKNILKKGLDERSA